MKKLLLIGSSLVALTIFALGGSVPDSQSTASVVSAIPQNHARVVTRAQAENQVPQEVSAQPETLLVNGEQTIKQANSEQLASTVSKANDVVVDLTIPETKPIARSGSLSVSTLKVAQEATLAVAEPTRVKSYGPNGTHWPKKIPTPFMYDTTVPNIIYVDPTWSALSSAIDNVTDAQANEGTLILIKSGTVDNPVVMKGYGNGSGSTPVLDGIGKEIRTAEFPTRTRTKRITVAPSNGFGTLRWEDGTHLRRVKGVAFAGIIAEEGIKARGGTQSAYAWILTEKGQSGFYGYDGQDTYGVEIAELVISESQAKSDDTVNIYSVDQTIWDFDVTGSYFAPRFWLYADCGTDCPHTDTFQYAAGGGGSYRDMTISDSVFFASNNAVIQTGNVIGMDIENSFIVGGSESQKHYPWLSGASKEGYQSAFNGSGREFNIKDSFVFGDIKLNTTDGPRKWESVTNTKINATAGKYDSGLNDPLSGDWTYAPTMSATSVGLPAKPTFDSLLALWGKDQTPRVSAPQFSPSEEVHMTSVSVSLTSSTPGATIYYTTNGTNPTTSSTRYTGPFSLTSTATVKAIAVASGMDSSYTQSKTYTVVQPGLPVITAQPSSVSAAIGGTATFTVSATANPAVSSYQWKKNGTNISGATSASYTTPALSASDSGSVYTVAVTNAYGATVSQPATLTVAQLTSTSSFQNHAIGARSGQFTIKFDVTPSTGGTDMVTGLSGGTATSYSGMSAIVRMKDGKFDVHSSGTSYSADAVVPYVGGQTYKVEIDVNTDTDKYTVRVDGTTIASNRTFRTLVSSLNYLTYVASNGQHSIGNINFGTGENNSAPTVDAGVNQTITLPTNVVSLDATVTDDGRPTASLTNTWIKTSGPGTVTFGNSSSVDTTAAFSTSGTYVLRLTSNDGDLSTYDEVTITVNSQTGVNQAPVVSAGADRTITLPTNSVSLDATVTDDGLPTGSSVSYAWTKVSGPSASFATASAEDTTATFTTEGTYVLRLTATDGALSSSDEVTVIVNPTTGSGTVVVGGELKKWHKVTLTMTGPTTSETATPNPFRDYKADVTFTHSSGRTYVVPAYFAADGEAGESDASSGNVWKAHFAPDLTGTWTYSVSFRSGSNIAISTSASAGVSAGYFDGETGSFTVGATDKTGRDLRGKGRLIYDGEHYLKYGETGERFIKAGVDSPENLLAYGDFDNTPDVGNGVIKTYSAHAGDYVTGDPSWKSGKGTELIGAVNYLANQGINSISFLTYNVGGDDGNVYPFIAPGDEVRFDTSKLDQWGEVFDHATKKGMYLHFKLMETENDGTQTNDEFKLYARELIARYGHNLALNWNLGEENGRSTTDLIAWAKYIKDIDPYQHNRVLHLLCGDFSTCNTKYFNMMGTGSELTGFSLQSTGSPDMTATFNEVKTYVDKSAQAGKKWVIGHDEPGDASNGVSTSNYDGARKHHLWAAIMAGGQGVEWYFGGTLDIGLQDFRVRAPIYAYGKYAIDFLQSNGLPIAGMTNANSLISGSGNTGNKVLAKANEVYLVQLINGGNATLDLSATSGTYNVKWLNPRTGEVTNGANVSGGGNVSLNAADSNDWIVLVKKGTGTVPNVAPVANAGSDLTVVLPATSVTINGTSSDIDGTIVSRLWSPLVAPAPVTITNSTTDAPTIGGLIEGVYTFRFRAVDDDGAVTTDDVNVIVTTGTPTSVYQENGGVLVIEAENTTTNLGAETGSNTAHWEEKNPGDTNYHAGATGDAYIRFYGSSINPYETPQTPIYYNFKINNAGTYQIHMRGYRDLETPEVRKDTNNDAYIEIKKVNSDGTKTTVRSDVKIAGGGYQAWGWADWIYPNEVKTLPTFTFEAGATYELTLSGRSRGFEIDRIAFRKTSVIDQIQIRDKRINESSKIEGGVTPNVASVTAGSTRVKILEVSNVRPIPSLSGNSPVGTAQIDAVGTVVGGPTTATQITWWNVDFDGTSIDGWVGGDNVELIGEGTGPVNIAPTVSAGSDIDLVLPEDSTTIAGTATDSDGTIASRQWSKVSGGSATLSGVTTNTLSVSGLEKGTYVFRFTATDNDGASSSDDVTVTVGEEIIPTGPVVYIRAGASGNGTSWSNALGSIPASASLVRGTTYYIGDGSYGGYLFDKAKSGTMQIVFKKATASDHGANEGWQSSYGDGQAVFTSFKIDGTGYFTLDGNIGSDKFAEKGILVSSQSRQTAFRIDDSDYVTIEGIEVDANYDDRISCNVAEIIGRDISEGGYNTTNITIKKSHFRNGGDDGLVLYNVKDLIFEDNEISDLFGYNIEAHPTDGCGNGHSDGIEIKTVTNAVFNRNYFHSIDKTSAFLPSNWTSNYGTASTDAEERNITVTNNIFHTPNASGAVYVQHMKDAKFFHNTISQGQYSGVIMETKGDYKIVENFNMANNIISAFAIKDEVGNSQLNIDYNLLIGPEVHSFNPHVPSANDINLGWEMNKAFPANLYAGSDVNAHYVPGKGHPNWGPEASAFTPAATNPGINKGKTGLPTSVTIGGVVVDISKDFFGNSRSGAPDMGAIEFSGTSQVNKLVAVSVFGAGDVNGDGISCGSDCSEVYSSGESVTLTATPRVNATFTGWSGACTGTGTCTVTVNDFKNVIATFNGGIDPDAWQIGDRVEATKTVRVRSGAGTGFATVIPDQNEGAQGTVTGGPASGSGLTWYKIKYDGYTTEGWTGADGLIRLTTGEADTTAPTVPANLTEVSVGNTSASISWSASTDAVGVAGYEILRNGSVVGTSNTTSFTLSGLTMNTTYSITVKAFDVAGNKSAASEALSITTSNVVDVIAPSAPTGLSKGTVTNTSASISWNESTDNVGVVGYDIYRNGALVGSSAVTSYSESGLAKATTYSYTVKAKDAAGNVSDASSVLSVTTTNVESKIPVRVPSFGPNGTHWPSTIPTPFMYDDSIPSVVVEPTWAAVTAALKNVTKAQADAGFRILIKPGTMTGGGIKSGSTKVLDTLGSANWDKRVVVAPRDGYGTVVWKGGVHIYNVQGVAFAGFKVEEPGIRFKGNNRSALAWINMSGGAPNDETKSQFLVGSSNEIATGQVELVEVVARRAFASDDDGVPIQGTGTGPGIDGVTLEGSYFAPRYESDAVEGHGHTDTVQMATGSKKNLTVKDTMIFASSNGSVQIEGGTDGFILDHSMLIAGKPSQSIYPITSPGNGPATAAMNGSGKNFRAKDSYIIGSLTLNSTDSARKWLSVENTRTDRSFIEGGVNDPLSGDWTVDTSMENWGSAQIWALSADPTDAYLAQIWAKDGVTPAYRTLTINKTGSGSVTGAMSGETFIEGANVTLTAVPATGATFTGWSGACSGTNSTCTVVMSSDKTVSASFSTVTNPEYTLTIGKSGTGTGTVTGATNGQKFASGANVTLTATPASGSTFAGWSGACTGTSATCTVVMSADKTATATFNVTTVTQYPLTITKSGTGTGTVSGATTGQQFPSGTSVTLTAAASSGSTFAGWSGACTGTSATCTVVMTSAKSVTATFNTTTLPQYTLTINKSGTGTGTVSGATTGQQFTSGTSVTLTAAANSGSTFAGWSGACSGTSSTCTVSMSANKTVGAAFNLVPAGTVATPTFSPSSATSEEPVSVTISTATAGAEIRYTTNGTTPSSSSTLYTGPITIGETRTVKAIALKSGMTNSSVASATYTITTDPAGPVYTSAGTWASKTFQELSGTATRTGTFEVTFRAKASRDDADVMTGLSNEVATSQYSRFTVFGPIFNFAPNGRIEARDGDDFDAENAFSYDANVYYDVRMLVNVKTRTYSMWVDGVLIADNYAFRSEQSDITQLSRFGYVAKSGSHTMTNVKIGPDTTTSGGDTDAVAPSVPAGLSVSSVTTSAVNLTWSASTDNVGVTGYEILRNGSVVGTSNTTSFSATGLSAATTYSFAVRAFDAAGNKSAASDTVSGATAYDQTLTSSKAWGTKSFTELSGTSSRNGTFVMAFSATPLASNSDVVVGLSNGAPTRFEHLGPIVRFNPDGKIDARNGSAYAAATSVSYSANQTYAIKLVVDVADRTYSAWVGSTQIANNYAFRTDQMNVGDLTNMSYYAVVGSHRMSNIAVGLDQ